MIDPAVIERAMKQFQEATFTGDRKRYGYRFAALKRILDRSGPDYAELGD